MLVKFFYQDRINLDYLACLEEAARTLCSGRSTLVLGKYTSKFEKDFADYTSSDHCIFVSNGLDAILIALQALDLGPGDDILVPCHTYIATWLAPLRLGCRIIAIPVLSDTFLIDPTQLIQYSTPQTKAVIPVHLYGNACDMNSIKAVADNHQWYVVEDAAQAHGAFYGELPIGCHGHITCFSHYPTKNLGALGEAGSLTTSDHILEAKIRSIRNYGRSSTEPGINVHLGSNYRGDEIQAAFLSAKLAHLNYINSTRKKYVKLYSDILAPLFPRHARLLRYTSQSAPHLAVLQLTSEITRNELQLYLNSAGIQTSIHYKFPCHSQPFIPNNQFLIDNRCIDQAQHIADTIISLPMTEVHTEEEIVYVATTILRYFNI